MHFSIDDKQEKGTNQWERLSWEATRVVETILIQKQRIDPMAYLGMIRDPYVTFSPATATAHTNLLTNQIVINPELEPGVVPELTELLSQSGRLKVPVLSGALIHELMHAFHSRNLINYNYNLSFETRTQQMRILHLWEESRIEELGLGLAKELEGQKAKDRTRILLRASASAVTKGIESKLGSRQAVESALALVMARTDIGLFDANETQEVWQGLTQVLEPRKINEALAVIAKYRKSAYRDKTDDVIPELLQTWEDLLKDLTFDEAEVETLPCMDGKHQTRERVQPQAPAEVAPSGDGGSNDILSKIAAAARQEATEAASQSMVEERMERQRERAKRRVQDQKLYERYQKLQPGQNDSAGL